MLPTLSDGDLLIYRRIRSDSYPYQPGSLVVALHPLEEKTLIVKRVHLSHTLGIELRGDNETASSDSRQFGLISKQQIYGIVEQIIPKDKH